VIPHRRDLSCSVCNERPAARRAGAPLEAEVPVATVEQVDDCLGRGGQRSLGADHVGTSVWDRLAVLDQGGPQLLADRGYPARLALARRVL
jgi:hypothetical protein